MSDNSCALYAEYDGKPKFNDLVALRLSPELLQGLKNGDLQFKASDTESFICSTDKTYRLSGSSCNPTVCLLQEDQRDADAFCLGTAVKTNLVADVCAGWIDWDTIPVYSSNGLSTEESLESIEKKSFCSPHEFETLWAEKGGVEVDGCACILAPELLHSIAIELNSACFQANSQEFDAVYNLTTKAYPEQLYRAIFNRFWPGTKLAKWIGIKLLNEMQKTSPETFLTKWKRDLLGSNLSLELLAGHYVDLGPTIVYVDRDSLSKSPKERLEYLYKFKPDWRFDELLPFYTDLCDVKEKRSAEAFIKSFAKVVNTGDPKARGKIIKKVQLIR